MVVEISVLVVGVVISIILSLAMSSGDTWQKKTYNAYLSALMGGVTVMLIQVLLLNRDVVDHLDEARQPSGAEKLEHAIASETMPSFRAALVDLKDRTGGVYENASRGDIELDEPQLVIAEWNRMFLDARTSVAATNYISERFWSDDPEFSRMQDGVHRRAVSSGVTVSRIFIFDSTDSKDQVLLRKISDQQKRLGIQVRFLDRSVLERSDVFLQSKSSLGGTIDFVVYDRQAVLLTIHRPETREIWRGRLSRARERVDAATRLFSGCWNLANDTIEAAIARGKVP